MKNLEVFFSGLFLSLLIGSMGYYYHDNYKMKQVIDSKGNISSCQVIRYRMWYEIRNCSNPYMNQQIVGLNEIKEYTIK